MFAILEIAGKQYIVSEKEKIDTDKIEGEAGATVEFDRVLLVSDEKTTQVGTPYVSGCVIKGQIVKQYKGEKTEVRRYKSKVRERRHIGFRPFLTQIEITSIKTS